jgi:putative oxidoreductase
MKQKISFTIRLIIAIILLQSLYFKFGGHDQAIHIFSTLGVEPWGRYLIGVIELLLSITILLPTT